MLDASMEEGLVVNSGWLKGGVWPWLGGIHGMAHTLLGNNDKAGDLLYAVANHAAPTGIWVEEQQAREFGSGVAGDVSDAEASAVFISQVRDMIAQERGDTLHLLNVIPSNWLSPGATIALNGGGSLFGSVTLRLSIGKDGRTAELNLLSIDGHAAAGGVVVHLDALLRAGFKMGDGKDIPLSIAIPWKKPLHISFRRM